MSICATCGKDHEAERKNLGIKINDQELQAIKLIVNRIECATQALSPSVVSVTATEQQTKQFVNATIEALASYKEMQSQWWMDIMAKYAIVSPEDVYVNFVTGDLYVKNIEKDNCKI